MIQCADYQLVQRGVEHLRNSDKTLSKIIDRIGEFRIQPRLPLFRGLVRTIISQQLGEPAARTLFKRFLRLYPNERPLPTLVQQTPLSTITRQGISKSKAVLIKQLAMDISSSKLSLRRLAFAKDDVVANTLMEYSGIGEWTANIFLMFSLGRIDALPRNDLALRRAVSRAYRSSESDFDEITTNWSPYRTIGTWYLWRSLGIDNI